MGKVFSSRPSSFEHGENGTTMRDFFYLGGYATNNKLQRQSAREMGIASRYGEQGALGRGVSREAGYTCMDDAGERKGLFQSSSTGKLVQLCIM